MNSPFNYSQAVNKLRALRQEHVLKFWQQLKTPQKLNLIRQIEEINPSAFLRQQQQVKEGPLLSKESFEPFTDFEEQGNKEDIALGKKMISEGQVGCIIVAGGQGTRLRFDGPKGMFAVSIARQKSLFQLFCEKTQAAGKQADRALRIAFMTSPQNHHQTVKFFEDHHFFDLAPEQVSFFSQQELPLLDKEGNLFLEEMDTLAMGPDGNGSVFENFKRAGLLDAWIKQGICIVNFVLIDNPLADPFDANLIGYHTRTKSDITIKCAARRDADEKVGLVVKQEDRVKVVEYSEMPMEERGARLENGSLKHLCANLSLFCFTLDRIDLKYSETMPWHLAYKAVKFVQENGSSVKAAKPMAWKFEKYIFDLLGGTDRVGALVYPRRLCFAPLKNHSGPDDLLAVQKALQERDREIIEGLTGHTAPEHPFELAQDFYYPTPELLTRWKGRPVPLKTYIE